MTNTTISARRPRDPDIEFSARTRRVGSVVVTFTLILFGFSAGFRLFAEGADYVAYATFYDDLHLYDPYQYTRFEVGFTFTAWLAKFIAGISFELYISIMMTAALLIKYRVFLRTQHPALTLLFYMATWYPLHEYTQVRAALAISLLFTSVDYISRGRRTAFLVACAAAFTFHSSSLFAVALIITAYTLSSLRLWMSTALISVAALVIPIALTSFILPLMQQLNPLTERYILSSHSYETASIFSGSNILTAIFLFLAPIYIDLNTNVRRIAFLVAAASIIAFIGLRDIPIIAHRLRELGLVFLALIAFDYKITPQRIPIATVAVALAAWSLYKSVTLQII